MPILHIENNDPGLIARTIINELVDVVNTVYTGSYTGSFTGSLQGSASYAFSALNLINSSSFAKTGSNIFKGDQTISGSSTNGDSALYFGVSGSVGSWRIAPEGINLVIQKWNGSIYTGGTIITP